MALPSNVNFCNVTGRFLRAVADTSDPGREPDGIPIGGLTVVFTAGLAPSIVRNSGEKVSIVIDPITCTTDAEGVLTGPDGTPGVMLVASEDEDLDPHGWTWTATISGPTMQKIATTFTTPVDGEIDLATVIPVPPNPGSQISQWQTVVESATKLRDEAEAARDAVVEALENMPPEGPVGPEGPKGDKGDPGETGTIAEVTATTLPPDADATVELSGPPEARAIVFGIPKGLPGGSDAEFATYVGAPGSNTRGALNAEYTVRRLWDGTAYPARAAGAVNLFVGPENPGAGMDPVMDLWANPDGTTLDEVLAEVQDTASPLRAAVKVAAAPERVEFPATALAPVDNRPPTMGTLSGSSNLAMGVPVLLFGDNTVQVAGATWRTPVGWSACRVYIDWGHNVSPVNTPQVNWQVRLAPGYASGTDLTVTTGLQTLAQVDSPPAVKTVKRFLISGNFTLNPAGSEVRLAISRLSTTFGGPAGLIKLILERTA